MKSPTTKKSTGQKVFTTPNTTKSCGGDRRNIQFLISDQHRNHNAKMAKRDALVKTQAAFFDAIQYLYTWPSEHLAFATGIHVKDFWEHHLDAARQCAYKAETIDPNQSGSIRYDIMAEIVKLEEHRLNGFLTKFENLQQELCNENDNLDEKECDQHMIDRLNDIETDVILSVLPKWIAETRRPPLTWYSFLETENFNNDRILAPEYYSN
jgi:hypothetical protein